MTEISSNGVSPTVLGARSDLTSIPNRPGVNHLGYRSWSDRLAPGWMRWSVITEVGARRAWQSRWLRRMLAFAWFPAIWFGFGFFAWEQAALYPEWRSMVLLFLDQIPQVTDLQGIVDSIQNGTSEDSRHTVWAWLLQSFFRYPQAVLMVMIVGVISPPLISQDIRSRAFLVYFSRPLTRWEYLIGKMATLWGYLLMISAVPALSLYVLGVLLSPQLNVVLSTWDLPLRVIAASIVLILPTSVLALCLSSLTQESRYAGFAWFAIWILGWFTFIAATTAETISAAQANFSAHSNDPRTFNHQKPLKEVKESVWTHLSPYHTLGRVQKWIFGFSKFEDVIASIVIILLQILVSLSILYHRISAPMRV